VYAGGISKVKDNLGVPVQEKLGRGERDGLYSLPKSFREFHSESACAMTMFPAH
jgi:hypothetical protein